MAPRVVLGVSGGIASYKAVEISRRLVDAGVHVSPVLTEAATRFVTPLTFSALASEPARTSIFEGSTPIPHTRLGQSTDLVLVAPATADLLARYAAGMANDLLTATLLATRAPVLVCPAMHTEMWEHASVKENLETLRRRGVHVVPPAEGRLAGGDIGAGRMAEPEEIVDSALSLLSRHSDLIGQHVLVSAGGTREPIDPVRHLTNRSSGKQGHALAEVASRRGARVTLVTSAGRDVEDPTIKVVAVDTAAEMEAALRASAPVADVVVMAAAVADFRPVAQSESKISKDEGVPTIVLEAVPDILSGLVAARPPGQVVVGFAAETHDAIARGRAKLERKAVDLLVLNDVSVPGVGFDHDTNAVTLLGPGDWSEEVPLTSKQGVADAVFDRVVHLLGIGEAKERKHP